MSLKREFDSQEDDDTTDWKRQRSAFNNYFTPYPEANPNDEVIPALNSYNHSSYDNQFGHAGFNHNDSGYNWRGTTSSSGNSVGNSSASSNYSSIAQNLMSKMGYQEGKGLGREQQGISAPIEANVQIDKKGLGFERGALRTNFDASFDEEEIYWDKKVVWLSSYIGEMPDDGTLNDWMEFGDRKLTIDDEDLFCDRDLLNKMLDLKSEFDRLDNKQLMKARSRANPYEELKNAIFQNRAALKMADMDYATGFIFSEPKHANGEPMLVGDQPDLLLFVDVCAGPGGFTEYLTWRRGWRCKGWGLTLKNPDSGSDFKLDRFLAGSSDSFEPYYGVDGANGDGDILKTENIDEFRSHVLKHSMPEGGVHTAMADGGFSVEGQENIQEILSKHLIMCQILTALSVLCKGGNFTCKLFDCFTLFTASLAYLCHMCFEAVGVYKPITSRPANSERYLMCRGYKGQDVCASIISHLRSTSDNLRSLGKNCEDFPQQDVLSLVPYEQMSDEFTQYLTESNNEILVQQVAALRKVIQFIKNPNLVETRQDEIRDRYLEKWKIPNIPRKESTKVGAVAKFQEMCSGQNIPFSGTKTGDLSVKLTKDNFKNVLNSVHEYRFSFVGSSLPREVWLSEGGQVIHRSTDLEHWSRIDGHYKIELPKDTIIEVERVQEHRIEEQGSKSEKQDKSRVIHITDVVAVGGQMVENKPFKERLVFAEQLARAVSKPSIESRCKLRVKELIRLEHLEEKLNLLKRRKLTVPSPRTELCVDLPEGFFYQCHGIRVVRILKNTYSMIISKSTCKFYFFDKRTGASQYEWPSAASSSFWDCKQNCSKWVKEPGVQFSLDEEHRAPDLLSRTELLDHLKYLKSGDNKSSPPKVSKT